MTGPASGTEHSATSIEPVIYVADANAIITPFRQGELGSLMVGLLVKNEIGNGVLHEARRWLEQSFRRCLESGRMVVTADVLDEVTKKADVPGLMMKDVHARGA